MGRLASIVLGGGKSQSAYVQKTDMLEMIDNLRTCCSTKLVRRPTIYSGL